MLMVQFTHQTLTVFVSVLFLFAQNNKACASLKVQNNLSPDNVNSCSQSQAREWVKKGK